MTPPSEVVALADDLGPAGLSDEWLALAAQLDATSYFQTPDWVLSWWTTIARRPPTIIALWRSPTGRLDALVAVSRATRRLHRRLPLRVRAWTVAGAGPGEADHCGWPVRPGRAADVRRWLADELRGAVLLEDLDPVNVAAVAPPGARRAALRPCPRIALSGVADGIPPSRKLSAELRRLERRVAEAGITIRFVPPEEMHDEVLDALFSLHEALFRRKGLASDFARHGAFHRRLISRAGRGRGPTAVVAERDGRIVGVNYGFLWRTQFYDYQGGWDPALAGLNLGKVMLLHAIRSVASLGVTSYDFLRGQEEYKYRFGASDRCDETWIVPRGITGRLLDLRFRALERRR